MRGERDVFFIQHKPTLPVEVIRKGWLVSGGDDGKKAFFCGRLLCWSLYSVPFKGGRR